MPYNWGNSCCRYGLRENRVSQPHTVGYQRYNHRSCLYNLNARLHLPLTAKLKGVNKHAPSPSLRVGSCRDTRYLQNKRIRSHSSSGGQQRTAGHYGRSIRHKHISDVTSASGWLPRITIAVSGEEVTPLLSIS